MLCKRLYSPVFSSTSTTTSHCISLLAPKCGPKNHRLVSTPPGAQLETPPVRVRFAPSPTGHIHLGGLRAALYNYIFARQHDGKFVLRIEDTDRARLVPGSAREIEDILSWAGIAPDESPLVGGDYGPYEQSKRLDLYRKYAAQLLASGKAYRCFCSPERLDLLRKYQARNREKTRYDGKCRQLTDTQVEEHLNEPNCKFVIRFALDEGQDSFDDLVFGTVTANLVEALESDPIIMKSDGYPTYHFANVLDDHLMEISHVLRGSEWLLSTIKHVQLYKSFGWKAPQFVHLPLVTMRDGSKLSKRNDDCRVSSWIEAGYQPETLLNFLTNSGGGVPKSKQDSNEFWTLSELIEGFDFKQLTRHPGSLDMSRLHIYSTKELQRAWAQDRSAVMRRFKELMERRQLKVDIDDMLAERIIGQLIGRLNSINDLLSHDHAFIWRLPQLSWSRQAYESAGWNLDLIVRNLIELVGRIGVEDKATLTGALKQLANDHKLDYGSLMKFIRKLLTNNDKGLPVHEICICLGRSRLIRYLEHGLEYVNKSL